MKSDPNPMESKCEIDMTILTFEILSMQVFDDLRNYVKAGREVSDKNHHREICPNKFHPSRP